jgi:hypothetical protein
MFIPSVNTAPLLERIGLAYYIIITIILKDVSELPLIGIVTGEPG